MGKPDKPQIELPQILGDTVKSGAYLRWLNRKAKAHVRRDRNRGNRSASVSEYKCTIHHAVCASGGIDAYTGEQLDWSLISTYDNAESKIGRSSYKAKFALLPTVDHAGGGSGPLDFKICAWRTNDAKSDLTIEEFVALCEKVLTSHRQRSRVGEAEALSEAKRKRNPPTCHAGFPPSRE